MTTTIEATLNDVTQKTRSDLKMSVHFASMTKKIQKSETELSVRGEVSR